MPDHDRRFARDTALGHEVYHRVSQLTEFMRGKKGFDAGLVQAQLDASGEAVRKEAYFQRPYLDILAHGCQASGIFKFPASVDHLPGISNSHWKGLEYSVAPYDGKSTSWLARGRTHVQRLVSAKDAMTALGTDGMRMHMPNLFETAWIMRDHLDNDQVSALMQRMNRQVAAPRIILELQSVGDRALCRTDFNEPDDQAPEGKVIREAGEKVIESSLRLNTVIGGWKAAKFNALAMLLHCGEAEDGRPHQFVAPDLLPGWRACVRMPATEREQGMTDLDPLFDEFRPLAQDAKAHGLDLRGSVQTIADLEPISAMKGRDLSSVEKERLVDQWATLSSRTDTRLFPITEIQRFLPGNQSDTVKTFDGHLHYNILDESIDRPSTFQDVRWWEAY